MLGEMLALAAAVVWAFAVIFLKRSGERVSPLGLNFFRVCVSIPLFLVTLPLVGQDLLHAAPARDYLILFASGVIGIGLADTLFHASLNRVGAGITGILDCQFSPMVVVLAYFMVGERIGPWQVGGMGLVIGGVLVASRTRPPRGLDRRTLLVGIGLGTLGMLFLAGGFVLAKLVLDRAPLIWATAMRQFGAFFFLLPVMLLPRHRPLLVQAFRPRVGWRYTVPGSILGSYLAVTLWIAGMKYTQAGVAAILNQTTTIYILLLATVFLGEPFSRRKLVAAALAVGGILMVLLG